MSSWGSPSFSSHSERTKFKHALVCLLLSPPCSHLSRHLPPPGVMAVAPPSPPAPSSLHPKIYPLLILKGRMSLVNTKETLSKRCSDFPLRPGERGPHPSLVPQGPAPFLQVPLNCVPPSLPPFQPHWPPAPPPDPRAFLPQGLCTSGMFLPSCSSSAPPTTFHPLLREQPCAPSKEVSAPLRHVPSPAQNLSPSELDLLVFIPSMVICTQGMSPTGEKEHRLLAVGFLP